MGVKHFCELLCEINDGIVCNDIHNQARHLLGNKCARHKQDVIIPMHYPATSIFCYFLVSHPGFSSTVCYRLSSHGFTYRNDDLSWIPAFQGGGWIIHSVWSQYIFSTHSPSLHNLSDCIIFINEFDTPEQKQAAKFYL